METLDPRLISARNQDGDALAGVHSIPSQSGGVEQRLCIINMREGTSHGAGELLVVYNNGQGTMKCGAEPRTDMLSECI